MQKSASQIDLRTSGVTSLYPRSYSSGINFQVVNGRVIKVDDTPEKIKNKKPKKLPNSKISVSESTINNLKLELMDLKNQLNRKILKRKQRKLEKKKQKLRKIEEEKGEEEPQNNVKTTIVLLYPQYVRRSKKSVKPRPVSMYF